MKHLLSSMSILGLLAGSVSFPALAQAEVKVVASIKPIHSLVASVMKGVGTPDLVVEGAGSPHTYSLRPSTARKIANADVVFWVGPQMESFLETPLENLANDATIVTLKDSHGLTLLNFREGGNFEGHDHDDHAGETAEEHAAHAGETAEEHAAHAGETAEEHAAHAGETAEEHAAHADEAHEEHADHDHEKHEEHADHDHEKHEEHAEHDHEKHEEHAEHDHEKHEEHADHEKHEEHAEHAGHDHGAEAFDMHIWLSPANAIAMLHEIEETLSKADPANAAKYAANAKAEAEEISKVSDALKADLKDYQSKPFVVFHDAYRYFEEAYNLNAVGSVTVSPEVLPGAKRLTEVRAKLENLGVSCVFSEAQFNPRMVAVLKEGTGVNSAEIDPLGSTLDSGPQLYTELLKQMGSAFNTCLSGNS
ncbi:zinc ABC transporter substrate-binding protein [Pseudovibrio sp. JE062]|uniref:zinc ABC transporter substrate-binding protein n=1 Tax=Pseudovibrio sp. JE062 TaxID=439495 RepID=UPI000186B5FF|nr:zinc ABC transporter substrate-binding protein [Pseudovibrio sp. JE062]EEA94030.1 periplasmic solute binding protein [Pseudovibrio sp. JE062]